MDTNLYNKLMTSGFKSMQCYSAVIYSKTSKMWTYNCENDHNLESKNWFWGYITLSLYTELITWLPIDITVILDKESFHKRITKKKKIYWGSDVNKMTEKDAPSPN